MSIFWSLTGEEVSNFKLLKCHVIKAKHLPKCNLGFFCECIWVKPLCKRIIMTKEALLGFTIFLFSGLTKSATGTLAVASISLILKH